MLQLQTYLNMAVIFVDGTCEVISLDTFAHNDLKSRIILNCKITFDSSLNYRDKILDYLSIKCKQCNWKNCLNMAAIFS